MCNESKTSDVTAHVPDFTVVGLETNSTVLAEAHAKLKDLQALLLKVCVGASYDATTNKICFSVPLYGDVCITSPVPIPTSAQLKACVETCGGLIPKGLKVTIYMNGKAIYSTVVGHC